MRVCDRLESEFGEWVGWGSGRGEQPQPQRQRRRPRTVRRGSIGAVWGACLPACVALLPFPSPFGPTEPLDTNSIQCMWIAGRPPLCIVRDETRWRRRGEGEGYETPADTRAAAASSSERSKEAIQMCGFLLVSLFCLSRRRFFVVPSLLRTNPTYLLTARIAQ